MWGELWARFAVNAVQVDMCGSQEEPDPTPPPKHCPTKKTKGPESRLRVVVVPSTKSRRLGKGGQCAGRDCKESILRTTNSSPPNLFYPPRRRRHSPPDHVQRCISRRSPGITAIGHSRAAQSQSQSQSLARQLNMSTSVGVNVRSPHDWRASAPKAGATSLAEL